MADTGLVTDRMKAAVVSSFGRPDDVLRVVDDFIKPSIDCRGEVGSKSQKASTKMLVKVQAVSLSPGDYRMLLGDKSVVANPESWPYIPCGDVSGTVVEVPVSENENDGPFKIGDDIVATWSMFGTGCLAEYALVDMNLAVKKPCKVDFLEGAAAANSAAHAMKVVEQADVKSGDRVLVLGGSGGVGSCVVQFARRFGASYIAATSTANAMLTNLGVDKVINYKEVDWWTIPEFQSNKFDVIIDCAEGAKAWGVCDQVLKTRKSGNGRFVAVVAGEWHIDGKSWWQVGSYLMKPFGRVLHSLIYSSVPHYKMYLGEVNADDIAKVLKLVDQEQLKIVLDSRSPHAFSTSGVREAFNLHIQRQGHGKIVIKVD